MALWGRPWTVHLCSLWLKSYALYVVSEGERKYRVCEVYIWVDELGCSERGAVAGRFRCGRGGGRGDRRGRYAEEEEGDEDM